MYVLCVCPCSCSPPSLVYKCTPTPFGAIFDVSPLLSGLAYLLTVWPQHRPFRTDPGHHCHSLPPLSHAYPQTMAFEHLADHLLKSLACGLTWSSIGIITIVIPINTDFSKRLANRYFRLTSPRPQLRPPFRCRHGKHRPRVVCTDKWPADKCGP